MAQRSDHPSVPRDRLTVVGSVRASAALTPAIALVLAGSVWPLPVAVVSVLLWLAVVPIARRLSDRVVLSLVIGAAVLVLLLLLTAVSRLRIDGTSSGVLAAVPGGVALVILLWGSRPQQLLPRLDSGLVPLVFTTAAAAALTVPALLDRSKTELLGGLYTLGFDNHSHFSIFTTLYQFGGLWEPADSPQRPAFDGYPPLSAALALVGTRISFSDLTLTPDQLLRPYAISSALTAALALGCLAWLTARISESTASNALGARLTTCVTATAGTAAGGVLCLGPALTFFDWGFSNFLLATALTAVTAWFAVADADRRPAFAAMAVSGGAAGVALLWTPLVLLLVAPGLLVLRRLVACSARQQAIALGACSWAAAVVVWQARRIAPDASAAGEVAATVGSAGGGLPLVPLSQGTALLVAGIAVATFGGVVYRRLWPNILGVALIGLASTAAVAALSIATGTSPHESYYVAKFGWAMTLLALPLLGAFFSLVVGTAVAHRPAPERRTPFVSTVLVVSTLLLWSTFTQTTGQTGFVATPSAISSTVDRWRAMSSGDDGERIFTAVRRLAAATPVVWDGGGVLENRWTASLAGGLSESEFNLYQALGRAPYDDDDVAVLRRALVEDSRLGLQIGFGKSATRDALSPLISEFPGRVRLQSLN